MNITFEAVCNFKAGHQLLLSSPTISGPFLSCLATCWELTSNLINSCTRKPSFWHLLVGLLLTYAVQNAVLFCLFIFYGDEGFFVLPTLLRYKALVAAQILGKSPWRKRRRRWWWWWWRRSVFSTKSKSLWRNSKCVCLFCLRCGLTWNVRCHCFQPWLKISTFEPESWSHWWRWLCWPGVTKWQNKRRETVREINSFI